MEKVSPEPVSGCWLWTGSLDDKGYGRVWAGIRTSGGNKRPSPASRVSYQLHVGEIPKGLVVRHKCDNPACVAPHHLEVGTKKENTQDMVLRGRAKQRPDLAARTHCKNGHPFAGENLLMIDGVRRCAQCRREITARYREKLTQNNRSQ